MKQNVVAIHQPNFFPWLGFFDKIIRADVFILMDNAQFPKTGGTWTNRVRIAINNQPAWLTLPVQRNYSGFRSIFEMEINNTTNWREKLLRTLQANYGRTPCYRQSMALVEEMVNFPSAKLSEFNTYAIHRLCEVFRIDTKKIILGSTLKPAGNATDLLINMTKVVGGTAYMCGGGSGGYQEDQKFYSAGIGLIYQEFRHPAYPQANTAEFLPGLSILDALFNLGSEELSRLLTNQAHNAQTAN